MNFFKKLKIKVFNILKRKPVVMSNFDQLEKEIPKIQSLTTAADANGFFIQEVIRFYSISGTLLNNSFKLNDNATVDERYITHPLIRSLLENFFTIIYLFDDNSKIVNRYDNLKNSFKIDYGKLIIDLNKPEWHLFMQEHLAKLEPVTWGSAQQVGTKLPDPNTMLNQLRTNENERLSYLYVTYRISSFDVHGRSLENIFKSVFGKSCNFPILNIKEVIELISGQYLVTLNDLRDRGVI